MQGKLDVDVWPYISIKDAVVAQFPHVMVLNDIVLSEVKGFKRDAVRGVYKKYRKFFLQLNNFMCIRTVQLC